MVHWSGGAMPLSKGKLIGMNLVLCDGVNEEFLRGVRGISIFVTGMYEFFRFGLRPFGVFRS